MSLGTDLMGEQVSNSSDFRLPISIMVAFFSFLNCDENRIYTAWWDTRCNPISSLQSDCNLLADRTWLHSSLCENKCEPGSTGYAEPVFDLQPNHHCNMAEVILYTYVTGVCSTSWSALIAMI